MKGVIKFKARKRIAEFLKSGIVLPFMPSY